jgi:hypothetical protein
MLICILSIVLFIPVLVLLLCDQRTATNVVVHRPQKSVTAKTMQRAQHDHENGLIHGHVTYLLYFCNVCLKT